MKDTPKKEIHPVFGVYASIFVSQRGGVGLVGAASGCDAERKMGVKLEQDMLVCTGNEHI